MARIIRTVIENYCVSDVVDAERAIYPRLEEAYEALKWWIARVPESGEIIDDENWLYMQDGDESKNIPALVIVYTFNHYDLTLKHILVRIPKLPKHKNEEY